MLLVITVHALLYGNFFDVAIATGGHLRSTTIFIKLVSRSAVDIFVLITGYFMASSAAGFQKSYKRLSGTYLKILFYSISLTAISLLLGPEFCTDNGVTLPVYINILRAVTPVSSQIWYYFTNYVLLCLLAPFLNLALQRMTKKQYAVLVAILGFVMSIWLTVSRVAPFKGWILTYGYGEIGEGKNVFSFIFLYIVGGFIGMHCQKRSKPDFRFLAAAFLPVLINYFLYTRLDRSVGYRSVAMLYSNPFVVLFAVFLLLFFKDLHFKSKIVNTVSSTTLGIYAIHDFCYFRNRIWEIFDFGKFDNSDMLISLLRLAAVVVAVFIACGAVELIRSRVAVLLAACLKRLKNNKIHSKQKK